MTTSAPFTRICARCGTEFSFTLTGNKLVDSMKIRRNLCALCRESLKAEDDATERHYLKSGDPYISAHHLVSGGDDLIDFAVSPEWLEHYYQQGMTRRRPMQTPITVSPGDETRLRSLEDEVLFLRRQRPQAQPPPLQPQQQGKRPVYRGGLSEEELDAKQARVHGAGGDIPPEMDE